MLKTKLGIGDSVRYLTPEELSKRKVSPEVLEKYREEYQARADFKSNNYILLSQQGKKSIIILIDHAEVREEESIYLIKVEEKKQ